MYTCIPMYITVPKNQKGYEEYDYGIEHTENMVEFTLPQEEFRQLQKSGVIRILEGTYKELYIAESESNIITADQLKAVYNAINVIPGVFMTAVDTAIKYGTCVYLDF